MNVLILTIFALCCASASSFQMQSTTYKDFPNKCNDGINMPIKSPFVRVGDKYYIIEAQEKQSWFGAAHICRSKNANLANIERGDEMNALSQHLVSMGYNQDYWFWISGNDLTTKGQYYSLSTGRALTFAKWSVGQPDLGGSAKCVHLWRWGGDEFLMNTRQCDSKAFYICEANTPQTVAITIW